MASIKYQAPIDEVRGSLGGSTFSRNAMGTFIRVRKKPRNPYAFPAVEAALRFSSGAKLWATHVPDANRADWNTLGANTTWVNALGQNYHPTGFNLYVRAQALLNLTGQDERTAVSPNADEADKAYTIDYVGGTGIRVTGLDGLVTPPDGAVVTLWSRAVHKSRYQFHGPWSFLRADMIDDIAVPFTYVADADLVADHRYFFFVRVVRHTGQASLGMYLEIDIPA